MPSSSYGRGRDSEYRAIRELENAGWQVARMAGSHGTADLVAWNDTGVRFVQIKTWRERKGSHAKDVAALQGMPLPPSARAEIWGRQMGQRGWEFQLVVQERP